MDVFLLQVQLFEKNFPGNLRRLFVINGKLYTFNIFSSAIQIFTFLSAPKIFPILFSMIKPILNSSLLDRIKIFDANKEIWLAGLLEEIELDEIPACYGGTNSKKVKSITIC